MRVDVDIPQPNVIARRIFSRPVKLYANVRLHALCTPYVPEDTGMLNSNVDITEDYVEYKSPYAHYQYEGLVYGPNIPTGDGGYFSPPGQQKHPTGTKLDYKKPLATAHWDKAMKAAKGDQLAREIEAYIRSR